MLFSAMMALWVPLTFSPVYTGRVFRQLYLQERALVALDNGAIRLGQADRRLFRDLEKALQALRALELVHHPLHACALVPVTALKCKPLDLAVEAQLRLAVKAIAVMAKRWGTHEALARSEAVPFRETLKVTRRSRLPLEFRRCPVCHLRVKGRLGRPANTRLEVKGNTLGVGLTRGDYVLLK